MLFNQCLDIIPTGSLTEINSSFKNETRPFLKILCYAVAAILGLFAGLRVYNLWNASCALDAQVISIIMLCKTSSYSTYHEIIKQMHEYEHIKYTPSYNHFLGSMVEFRAIKKM